MNSFQAKIGWKKMRNKNYRSVPFLSYPTGNRKFQKKKKKFKKLKNTIVASLQAKIGWRKLRKNEIKNYRSVSFLPHEEQKIQKKI